MGIVQDVPLIKEDYEELSFEFLGYEFRPRRCVNKKGEEHPNFLPAISKTSKKAINRVIRSWHIQLKSEKSLVELSKMFNPVLAGWSIYLWTVLSFCTQ